MRASVRAVVAAALLGTAACRVEDAPVAPLPTEATVVGVYNLSTANGGPLPFPLDVNDTTKFEVVSGRVTVNADHTFADMLTTRLTYTSGSQAPIEHSNTQPGTWTLAGNILTLTYGVDASVTAIVIGKQLTKSALGVPMGYTK